MSDDVRTHVRALVDAMPEASAVPVPRAWLLHLLASPPAPPPTSTPPVVALPTEPRLLTVQDVARRLSVSKATVYRHATEDDEWAPFVRKMGARTLRFDERGLAAWMARRRPRAA